MAINKSELAALLKEKDKRDRVKKPRFKPHPGQLKVINSKALEKFVFCSNGWGKTAFLVNNIHWLAHGYNPITEETSPVPATIYLVIDTPDKMAQVIIPEYRKWHPLADTCLKKNGKPHVSSIEWPNGSVLHVLTHDVSPLRLEGVQLDALVIDEPLERHIYIALKRGGRIPGRPLKVLMCGTPLYFQWMRNDIYEEWLEGRLPDTECFTGEIQENPHLEQAYIDSFSRALSEKEKLTRLKGHFFDASGAALAHLLDKKKHLVPNDYEWDKSNPCVIAIDPHPSKKHVAVLMGADKDNRLFVLEEAAEKLVAREFIRHLVSLGWFTKYRIQDIVYDSLGSADTTSGEGFRSFGEVINEELKRFGLGGARATTYEDKSDEAFIERIKDALAIPEKPDNFGQRTPKLRIYERCRQSWEDMKRVQWMYDRKLDEAKPKLDIRNTDRLACIKYALATNINYFKKKAAQGYGYKELPYGRTRKPKSIMVKYRGRST